MGPAGQRRVIFPFHGASLLLAVLRLLSLSYGYLCAKVGELGLALSPA
jgi:hypothetical protein